MAAGGSELDVRDLTEVVGRLRRALRRSIRSDYPWERLPMARVELLHALVAVGPARVGTLARAQRLAQNTVSELVQALVDDGLAVRAPDPLDGRANLVAVTARGAAELARWSAANESRMGAALTSLSVADQAAIRRAVPALGRLVDRLESDIETPGA